MTWKRSGKPHGWYPRRGEVCLFKIDKDRPALVISSDVLNRFSLDVCVVPISTAEHRQFSMRPKLRSGEGGLDRESWAKCDKVTTLQKDLAVYPPLGMISNESLKRIESAVCVALDIPSR
jgi:mRNA interferase MazF